MPDKSNGITQGERFWIATQAIIVGLAVKAALEHVHRNVADGIAHDLPFSLERALVYTVFGVLLVRFYAGALRFGMIPEHVKSRLATIKNLIGASSLFSLFYLVGSSVDDTALFFFFFLCLHVIDGIWFALTLSHTRRAGLNQKARIAAFFLSLSVATVILLILAPPPVIMLLLLLLISGIDFTSLMAFYFEGEPRFGWEASSAKAAAA